jgi:pimeloyl-ACP methyl ester carboxylesterase
MAAQIAFFRSRYRVIAMDSRDQGKSGDSPRKITYEKMTDDLAALLDHLKTGPVDVLGWSDGGIEALLLGIRHPAMVKKIAAMAANLNSSTDAVYPETWAMARSMLDTIPAAEKDTPQGRRAIKVTSMMFEEPNIAPSALEAITAPTLVLASDHDLISDEHTLDIFHHVPNSQLCIIPDATHMVPYDAPALQRDGGALLPDAVREEGPDQGRPRVLRIADGVAAEEVGWWTVTAQTARLVPLAFVHATVLDATGAPARPNQIVVVRGDRNIAVGSSITGGSP